MSHRTDMSVRKGMNQVKCLFDEGHIFSFIYVICGYQSPNRTSILSGGNHPIHIHGYSFYLVGKGSENFNNATDPQSYNLVNPPLINTFGVTLNGWITVRFVANNPGKSYIGQGTKKEPSYTCLAYVFKAIVKFELFI